MTVLVVGAGGVGAFFGGLLARAGVDVCFVARGAQLDALRDRGIRIESLRLGTVEVPRVRVVARASEAGPVDSVLLAVKTYQTAAVLDDLASVMRPDTVLLTLQNGVESDEEVAVRFGRARVLPAVVYVGATLERPGVVSHVAAGTIALGTRPGIPAATVARVAEVLQRSRQPVHVSSDIQRERWVKLLWNASFNPLSAITDRTPLDLLQVPATRALVIDVMAEVVAVGRAEGVAISGDDIAPQISWTEQATAIRTSMMVDRERGRPLEADALLGVVVRKGQTKGIATPVSRILYALLQALSSAGLHASTGQWMPPPIPRT